jgi:FkbM family methyltransferase
LPWFTIRGDETLRLDYDLNERSLVFDLGGYKGQWTSDIFSRFCPTVHVFEVVPKFADCMRHRFERNNRIHVHPFGLAGHTRKEEVRVVSDGTSLFASEGDPISVDLVQAASFFRENAINEVDLVKINIEGGEYELLEHLLETGLVRSLREIQVQFHDCVPDAPRRMLRIQERLAVTHQPTWQFPFVWENWRRRAAIDDSVDKLAALLP